MRTCILPPPRTVGTYPPLGAFMIALHRSMRPRCSSTLSQCLSQTAPSAMVTSSLSRSKDGIRVCMAPLRFSQILDIVLPHSSLAGLPSVGSAGRLLSGVRDLSLHRFLHVILGASELRGACSERRDLRRHPM